MPRQELFYILHETIDIAASTPLLTIAHLFQNNLLGKDKLKFPAKLIIGCSFRQNTTIQNQNTSLMTKREGHLVLPQSS